MSYIPSREACRILGIHANTLRKYADNDKIDIIKVSGQRRYNVDKYISENGGTSEQLGNKNICYCRVSSNKQTEDLERQVKYLQEAYPDHEIIKDVGSGINNKRRGLKKILEYSCQKRLNELVVAHKDRLSRFGFDLIEQVINLNGGRIVVHKKMDIPQEEELSQDILSIITVFAAKIRGSRSYKSNKSKDSETPSE